MEINQDKDAKTHFDLNRGCLKIPIFKYRDHDSLTMS